METSKYTVTVSNGEWNRTSRPMPFDKARTLAADHLADETLNATDGQVAARALDGAGIVEWNGLRVEIAAI